MRETSEELRDQGGETGLRPRPKKRAVEFMNSDFNDGDGDKLPRGLWMDECSDSDFEWSDSSVFWLLPRRPAPPGHDACLRRCGCGSVGVPHVASESSQSACKSALGCLGAPCVASS